MTEHANDTTRLPDHGSDPAIFRRARREDVPAIVALLAEDPLGAKREAAVEPTPQAYWDAFSAMERQGGNWLIVAERAGVVVGCLQLTVIPGLSRMGARRAQIEGVRIAASQRGRGLGEALMRHALVCAREEGCVLAQLTTDAQRSDAHRFYERLGFVASHVGMKLSLQPDA